jgi:hypothetical protein
MGIILYVYGIFESRNVIMKYQDTYSSVRDEIMRQKFVIYLGLEMFMIK